MFASTFMQIAREHIIQFLSHPYLVLAILSLHDLRYDPPVITSEYFNAFSVHPRPPRVPPHGPKVISFQVLLCEYFQRVGFQGVLPAR